jgi:hypothetical protein
LKKPQVLIGYIACEIEFVARAARVVRRDRSAVRGGQGVDRGSAVGSAGESLRARRGRRPGRRADLQRARRIGYRSGQNRGIAGCIRDAPAIKVGRRDRGRAGDDGRVACGVLDGAAVEVQRRHREVCSVLSSRHRRGESQRSCSGAGRALRLALRPDRNSESPSKDSPSPI